MPAFSCCGGFLRATSGADPDRIPRHHRRLAPRFDLPLKDLMARYPDLKEDEP